MGFMIDYLAGVCLIARLSTWKLEHPGIPEVLMQNYVFLLAHSSQQFFIYLILGMRLTSTLPVFLVLKQKQTKKE
jgi:hypothetical protein